MPFKKRTVSLVAGTRKNVPLRLSKKNRKRVAAALAKPKVEAVSAFVKVVATDAGGNESSKRVKFKIREPKRK